jgi:acetyl esterase/lipase
VGSPKTHRDLLARLAVAADARVLAIDYRLAPEHPCPAAIEDAVAAVRWMLSSDGGAIDPDRLFVAGDSAGGGLTLSTLLALRDAGAPLPRGGVLISPWLDLERTRPSIRHNAKYDWIDEGFLLRCARDYRGGLPHDDARLRPLEADLRGLPSLLVQVGSAELLHDEGAELAQRARAQGVDAQLEVSPDMVHVWHLFADLIPEAEIAIQRIARFVQRCTA